MPRSALPAYATTASLARSATEAAPPAILLVTLQLGMAASVGPLLVAALTGAAAVAGPVVGALLDRTTRPRRAFAAALVVMAAALTVLAILLGTPVPPAVLLLLAFAAGTSWPTISGAWSAQLPHVVPEDGLPRAYSVDAATYSVAAVVGPPLAAVALALGPHAPLLVPAVLLVVAVATLQAVPIATREVGSVAARSLLGDLRAGFGCLWTRRALRRTTVTTTFAFAGQAGLVIAAPLVSQRLTGGLGFTGWLLGAFAVGGVVTALLYTRRPVTRPDLTVMVTTAVAGVALAGVGLAPGPALALALSALMGATDAPMLQAMFQVRTREAPRSVLAQVFTTSASLRLTAFAAMSAWFGAIIGAGPAVIAVVGGAVHLLGVVLGLVLGPPLRRPARGPAATAGAPRR